MSSEQKRSQSRQVGRPSGKNRRDDGLPRNKEAEQEKVFKEQPAVKPVGEMRKRHRNRNLAVGRRQKPKIGPRRKLVAVRRGTTLRAKMVQCKEHGLQGEGKDMVASKGRRQRAQQQCNKAIRKQDIQENHWTGDRQENCHTYCRVANNQELHTVEESTPSETV
jgi:hypothetical protein